MMRCNDCSDIESPAFEYFYQQIKEYIKYSASKDDYEEAKHAEQLSKETFKALNNKTYRVRSPAEKNNLNN